MRKHDDALGEAVDTAGVDDVLDPGTFNVEEWLRGLAPATAIYEFGDATFHLQATTDAWRSQFLEDNPEMDDDEKNLVMMAKHFTNPTVTVDQLRQWRDVAAPEFGELTGLLVTINTKPRNQIPPRFLPAASG